MKVGRRRANGDRNRASIGLLQVKADLIGAKLARARTAIAAHVGKRAFHERLFGVLQISVDLKQEKFLLLQEKFLSVQEKFLLIQMNLRSRHTDVDSLRATAEGAASSLRSGHAALPSSRADVPSLHTAFASIHAPPWLRRVAAIRAVATRDLYKRRSAALRARLAPDALALRLLDLTEDGVDVAAEQAVALSLPIDEIRRARRRFFDHASAVAKELPDDDDVPDHEPDR